MDFLNVFLPSDIVSFPAFNLARHFRIDDRNHAIQNRVHVIAAEVGVTQVCPAVDIRGPKFFVLQQCIEHGNVALPAWIIEGFRIAWIRVWTLRRNARVIRTVSEGVVHVPEGISPLFS